MMHTKENALKIANMLNQKQTNVLPCYAETWLQREVMNLSNFGFALNVTKIIPARHLRIPALKRLLEMTNNPIVCDQIKEYLEDDRKWDYQIADNLAFELQRATN